MRRILVVDDDPHICLAIRAWLKRYGFMVAIAEAEPHRRSLTATVANAVSGKSSREPREDVFAG